jgi:hypothetical protein
MEKEENLQKYDIKVQTSNKNKRINLLVKISSNNKMNKNLQIKMKGMEVCISFS